MKQVKIGIVGTKFIATIHAHSFGKTAGGTADLHGVVSGSKQNAEAFARKFGIPNTYATYEEMMADPAIEMVDICTPNDLHRDMVTLAAEKGKHVICEKPLTGGFGEGKDVKHPGINLPKADIYAEAMENAYKCKKAVEKSGVIFGYAENYLYTPPYNKLLKLLKAGNGSLLDIRGEESHSGSHASYARFWKQAGGGSLVRLGSHAIAVALHLKHDEGIRKTGNPIRPVSVTCEVANNTKIDSFAKEKEKYLRHEWVDVEDWSIIIITFEDGTKSTIFSNDCTLGGCKNLLQIYTSNGVLYLNPRPNTVMQVYAPREGIWGNEPIAEKLETNGGWNFVEVDDDTTHGYVGELQDFLECAETGRQPVSGMQLAVDTVNIMYAGYLSAEQGKRISLDN